MVPVASLPPFSANAVILNPDSESVNIKNKVLLKKQTLNFAENVPKARHYNPTSVFLQERASLIEEPSVPLCQCAKFQSIGISQNIFRKARIFLTKIFLKVKNALPARTLL